MEIGTTIVGAFTGVIGVMAGWIKKSNDDKIKALKAEIDTKQASAICVVTHSQVRSDIADIKVSLTKAEEQNEKVFDTLSDIKVSIAKINGG